MLITLNFLWVTKLLTTMIIPMANSFCICTPIWRIKVTPKAKSKDLLTKRYQLAFVTMIKNKIGSHLESIIIAPSSIKPISYMAAFLQVDTLGWDLLCIFVMIDRRQETKELPKEKLILIVNQEMNLSFILKILSMGYKLHPKFLVQMITLVNTFITHFLKKKKLCLRKIWLLIQTT
jgi:hypothetical protein